MCVVLPALVKAVREAGSPELYTISERIYTKRLADQARVLIESGRREGGKPGMDIRTRTLQINEFAIDCRALQT